MKKIDKQVADNYFRTKNKFIAIYLIIWAIVSFGMVSFAESFHFSINGFPFHYFMAAQGAVVTFIILLFINAKMGDKIDEKFGISDAANQQISQGKTLDH